jgi:hypothetical protein
MRILIVGVVALLAAGCATTAKEPPVTKVVPVDASNIAEAQAAGYKVVNENGKDLLCRKELLTGSHARYRTSCLTLEEWKSLADTQRASVQDMSRRRPPPQAREGGR